MTGYAYYCLHELRLLPSQFLKLDRREKAFVIASIDMRAEQINEERKKLKKK